MMNWRDESWKDSYDDWKLLSPYDDEPDDECCHEDYEADINGRAHCCVCDYTWYLTAEEIDNERRRHEAYDQMMRHEARRERFARIVDRLAFWRRWRKPAPITDEIPF